MLFVESPTPIPAQGVSADVIDLSLDAKLRQFSVVVSSGQMNLARLDVESKLMTVALFCRFHNLCLFVALLFDV